MGTTFKKLLEMLEGYSADKFVAKFPFMPMEVYWKVLCVQPESKDPHQHERKFNEQIWSENKLGKSRNLLELTFKINKSPKIYLRTRTFY